MVRFNLGKECPIPYLALKEEFPLETVEYIMEEVDEQDQYGRYAQWARQILREQRRRKVGLLKILEDNKARRDMVQKEWQDEIQLEKRRRRLKLDPTTITLSTIN